MKKPRHDAGFRSCEVTDGPKIAKFPVFSMMIRESYAESSSHPTASSAIQSVQFHYNLEMAANSRAGGLIRSARGSG